LAKRAASTRICTSVSAESPEELASKAELAFSLGSDLVEFRVDRLTTGLTPRELEAELSVFAKRAVFTLRPSSDGGAFEGSEARRLDLLSRLAEMGPAYLDVELDTAKANSEWAGSLPRDVEVIASWHDYEGTPDLKVLRAIREEELGVGSLAKLVTTAGSSDDNLATLALCADEPLKTISFCMGELGTLSRVVSMRLGAPLVYASLPEEAIAPGQLSVSTMRALRSLVV
jgi:3-dehydroquinate dehydratase type I